MVELLPSIGCDERCRWLLGDSVVIDCVWAGYLYAVAAAHVEAVCQRGGCMIRRASGSGNLASLDCSRSVDETRACAAHHQPTQAAPMASRLRMRPRRRTGCWAAAAGGARCSPQLRIGRRLDAPAPHSHLGRLRGGCLSAH